MLRYKNAKNKSNYVSITVKSGVDLELPVGNGLEETKLMSNECKLVFCLVPGEHVASVKYDAGVINGTLVVGEVRVNYAYKDGRICVCEYDFKHKGYYEEPPHYTRPEFHLYEKTEDSNLLNEKEPLLVVSASRNVNHMLAFNDILPEEVSNESKSFNKIFSTENRDFSKALDKIQARLRTVYSKISDALSSRGIFLSVHIDDFIERDENGTPVNGYYVDKYPNWMGPFVNVVGSSDDKPEFTDITSWIEYYGEKVCNDRNYFKTPSCASHNMGLACYIHGLNNNIGGHVLIRYYNTLNIQKIEDANTVQVAELHWDSHKVMPYGEYKMLPICPRHNNRSKWDVAMYVPEYAKQTLLYLTNFIPIGYGG